MIDISFEKNPELYKDYEKCLDFLKNTNFIKSNKNTNFHLYSEIRSEKELLCVQSFFATQNYHNNRLIIWSDYDISNKSELKKFKDYITFKIYDPLELSKNTILEEKYDFLFATDSLYYLKSDLLRLLACTKYGGFWIDMDIVFLRDMSPLIDQEFLYMWGSETDFVNQGACASVMNLFKDSELGNKFLKMLIQRMPEKNSTTWGKELFRDVYRDNQFNILPSTFFNTEWCINIKHHGLGTEIETQWFDKELKNKTHLFLEAFTWHWHNSSFKNKNIVPGSKFYLLQQYINKILIEKDLY